MGDGGDEPSPGTGRKTILGGRFFRPVPGLSKRHRPPSAHALGYFLTPSGLWTFSSVQVRSDTGDSLDIGDFVTFLSRTRREAGG